MSRKRRLFFVAVAGTILATMVVLVFNTPESQKHSHTLPDGTVIILRGITTGTQHCLVDGNVLQRAAGRLLPDAWAKKLGATVMRKTTIFGRSLIWVERRFPTNLPAVAVAAPVAPLGVPDFNVLITDDHGAEAKWPFGYINRNPEREIQATFVEGIPSSSPTIGIHVRSNADGPTSKRQASFIVPNPSFLKHPKWRGSPYPITVRQDELTFRLDRFECIASGTRPYSDPVDSNTSRFTEFDYQINDASVPSHHWSVQGLCLFDEGGGKFYASRGIFHRDQSRTNYACEGSFSTNVAWKLKFELQCSHLVPSERQTFRAVPVPGGGPDFQPIRAQWRTLTLAITNFTAGGDLAAVIEPPDERWVLRLVEAQNQDGVEIKNAASYIMPLPPGCAYACQLKLPPGTTHVDLTFGLHRRRVIEVLAQPMTPPAQ